MKSKQNCKIVQDLLPNYIEKLTNEETNHFIENHIENCEECTNVLKNMNGDLQLEKINQNKEIKYLKKLKRRNNIIYYFILLIVVLVLGVIVAFFTTATIPYNENNELDYWEGFKNWLFPRKVLPSDISNMVLLTGFDTDVQNDESFQSIWIFTFDKKDKCIGAKIIYIGLPEEEIQDRYENWTSGMYMPNVTPMIGDVKIEDGKLSASLNVYNGRSREEIRNYHPDAIEI